MGLDNDLRRQLMAQVVQALAPGAQAQAERKLGWPRGPIGKGLNDLEQGPLCEAFKPRGRQPTAAVAR